MLNSAELAAVEQWVAADIRMQNMLRSRVLKGEAVRVVVGVPGMHTLVELSCNVGDEPTREIQVKRYPVQVP